ncbi:uncharacterized protein RCH25_018286 [Pelodytes ibericus]
MVTEGGSVTISCSYNPNKYTNDNSEFRFYWGKSQDQRCYNIRKLYSSSENFIHRDYHGKITRTKIDDGNRTESITIHDLTKNDNLQVCCHIIELKNNTTLNTRKNIYGTQLLFSDHTWVDQLDTLIAVQGEDIIIPCRVHYPPGTNSTVQKVTWRQGKRCNSYYVDIYTSRKMEMVEHFSVVNFPSDLSLHIRELRAEDKNRYCCIVTTSEGIFSRYLGTELVIKESTFLPGFSITQSPETSVQIGGVVTIPCSFTQPQDGDLVYVRVYWRVGSPRGPYAYHPSEQMVDPRYKRRTELRGQLDLHITEIQEEDSTSFYCFVMLTVCAESYKYHQVVDHGPGTKLTMAGLSEGCQEAVLCIGSLELT